MDVNEFVEIEEGICALLAPLKADKAISTLEAVGGVDYEVLLASALAKAPFALVKVVSAVPETEDGGVVKWTAAISVLIGVKSFRNLTDQRMGIYKLLKRVENALCRARLSSAAGDGVYWPLRPTNKQWSAMSGGGVEVWELQLETSWEVDYEN